MRTSSFRGSILALAMAWPLALAQAPAPANPADAAEGAQSVVAASQATVPADDSDLAALRTLAEQARALANDCNAKPCPVVETCEAAARLLQALSDAQAYLQAIETALNQGAAAAAAAHNNVVSQTRITSTNLKIAMEALAVKEYLSRFAQLMFDLASLSDDLKGMAEKGTVLPGENAAQKLDTAYETIKDAISVASDMKGVVDDVAPPPPGPPQPPPPPGGPGIVTSTPVGGGFSELAGQGQEMAGRLEDVKSSLSDAANAIDEARKEYGKTGKISKDVQANIAKAAAKILFRELKAQVDREIEALKKQIAELEKNLAAEEKILAGLFRERMRMNARRDAATDARRAITAARDALVQCMSRTCGMPTLTRPSLPNYYAPPPGMNARDLARHQGWGAALRDLNPRLAAVAALLRERFVVKNVCPGGGPGTSVDPGQPTDGPVTGGLRPRNEVRTSCAPCQPIADQIARILDEIEFRRAEIERIERRQIEAIKLRADLQAAQARLRDLNRYLSELRDIIRQAQVGGISVAGKGEQDLALAEGQRVQLVGEISYLQREIAAIEAERPKLAEHRGAIQELHAKRRVLREQLRYCEEDRCRVGYYGELDTWINIAGNNPLDPQNPTGGTTPGGPPPEDTRPRVTVTMTRATGEGQAPGVFTISLSRPSTANLFIAYSFSGSAVRGSDFEAVSVGAPIPAGATSAEVTITPIDDTIVEGPETVEMVLLPGTGYALGVPSAATMPFSDNDAPPQPAGTLQFAQSSYSIAENGGAILITVTRTGGSSGAVTVNFATAGGSASPGADFQAASGTLTWANGDTAGKTISIPIVDDNVVENTETFQVILSNPSGGATLGAPATATVSIADNDVATGPCGATGNAWQNNVGTYSCSGNCNPSPASQALTVNGDIVTVNPFHAGGAATFQGCGSSLQSQSSSLTYFGQSNHRATITRNGDRAFSAAIQSSGGGTCQMSCSR